MKEQYRYIIDMDGTLYSFDKGVSKTFGSSKFGSTIRKNVVNLLAEERGTSREDAFEYYTGLKSRHSEQLSVGVEKELGIDRHEYFERTWNLDPEEYVVKDPELKDTLAVISEKSALLTSAPRIWAINVLAHLEIDSVFGEKIYTGEDELRKPNPQVFKKIAEDFQTEPENVISIGDQEHSDIIPAKQVGMKTVFIGDSETTANYKADDIKAAIYLLQNEGLV